MSVGKRQSWKEYLNSPSFGRSIRVGANLELSSLSSGSAAQVPWWLHGERSSDEGHSWHCQRAGIRLHPSSLQKSSCGSLKRERIKKTNTQSLPLKISKGARLTRAVFSLNFHKGRLHGNKKTRLVRIVFFPRQTQGMVLTEKCLVLQLSLKM